MRPCADRAALDAMFPWLEGKDLTPELASQVTRQLKSLAMNAEYMLREYQQLRLWIALEAYATWAERAKMLGIPERTLKRMAKSAGMTADLSRAHKAAASRRKARRT